MNPLVLKTSGPLVATLATLLCTPALTSAATLIDHVPYAITSPGVYEIQSNLSTSEDVAIRVFSADVLINLNGFTLAHAGAGPSAQGILIFNPNVTVRNGTVSGWFDGVLVGGAQCTIQDLKVLGSVQYGVWVNSGNDCAVVDCFIIGTGKSGDFIGIFINTTDDLLKNNHISGCHVAIHSNGGGSAYIQNYLANSHIGLSMQSGSDYFQGNVATNCTNPFTGLGHAIGTENGGD
jgi:hypothetical protein